MVADPNFWRRFSVAVHQADAEKDSLTTQPQMKHSYVHSISSLTSAHIPQSPTSESHLSPALSPITSIFQHVPSPLAAHAPRAKQQRRPPPAYPPPSKLRKSMSTRSTHPLLPTTSHSKRPSTSLLNISLRSPSCLSLSGRPGAQFRTWTTVTGGANACGSDSWLSAQNRKARQRTWLCWLFWLCALVLVAGVVVAVVILRAHGII
jgi:hypothetical protein